MHTIMPVLLASADDADDVFEVTPPFDTVVVAGSPAAAEAARFAFISAIFSEAVCCGIYKRNEKSVFSGG